MKTVITKNALTAVFLAIGTLFAAEPRNPVENPSFEEGTPRNGTSRILPGWFVRSHTAKIHRIAESGGSDGKRAAVITAGKNETGYFTPKSIHVPSGARIRLQAHYRFTASAPGASAALIVTPSDSKGKRLSLGSIRRRNLEPSADWKTAELLYQLPETDPNGYNLNLKFQLTGPGEAWFDQIDFQMIPPEKNMVEFYPSSVNSEKTLYPIKGESSQLLFYIFTNGSSRNRTLELDVPEGFPLAGAAPVFTGSRLVPEIGVKKKNGRLLYEIPLEEKSVLPIKRAVNDLFTGTGLLFQAYADLKPDVLNWRIEGIGSGAIRIAPLEAQEPSKLPEHFKLYTWYTPLLTYIPSDNAVAGYLNMLKKSGVCGGSVSGREQFFNREGFANYRSTWYATPKQCLTEMLNGTNMERYFSTMLDGMKKFDRSTLVWNYEPGLEEYYHFCEVCRKAFEKASGKTTKGLQDGQSVEKKYPEEYLRFRDGQKREIVRRFSELCRRNRVSPVLNSYVFPAGEAGMMNFRRRIGDVASYRELLDNYSAQVYFSPLRLWDQLENNLSRWPGMIPCFTSDERHNGDTYSYSLLKPEQVYLETVIAALQGCPAVHFFVGVHTFDGRQMLALRRAMNEIAAFERFLFRGTVVPNAVRLKTSSGNLRHRFYRHGNEILVALVNPDPAEKTAAELQLLPELPAFNITEPLKKKKFTRKKSDVFSRSQSVVFELNPNEIRYLLLSSPKQERGMKTEEVPEHLRGMQSTLLLNENGFKVTAAGYHSGEPDVITVEQGTRQVTVDVKGGAMIHAGNVKLFRDNLKYPASSAWSPDFMGRYRLKSCRLNKGELEIEFEKMLSATAPVGLLLTKKLSFSRNLNALDALVSLTNTGKKTVEIAYWNWNQPDVRRKDFIVERPGSPAWKAEGKEAENHYLPVRESHWAKVSGKYYFGWDSGRPTIDGQELDKFYLWTGGEYPTLEQIGYKQEIKPGKTVRIKLHFRVVPPPAAVAKPHPGGKFRIDNPYAENKRQAFRASLHNHAQFAPSYKHAPVSPAERLQQLQKAEVTPRYGIGVITEHTRITLPSNTTPPGAEPQWGVDGILFVPGMEGTIGSWSYGTDYGHFFGEINCVGVSRECKDPADQKTYRHSISPYPESMTPEVLIGRLLDDGVFVGLCHPNAKLDKHGAQRWGTSGYNYDELDILFGNPEKLMPPLSRLPIALEIGNQGYDLSDRSGYKNAEEKWDMLLTRGHRLYGTASDDAHHQTPMAGWIVVYVNELTQRDFMDSLLKGNFYASQGPELKEIKLDGRDFSITADQPSRIEFIGGGGRILKKEENVTRLTYRIKGDEQYIRARVTRNCPEMREAGGGIGRRRSAWTNPLFINPAK